MLVVRRHNTFIHVVSEIDVILCTADMEGGSPNSQPQQVIVNNPNTDYNSLPSETTSTPEETFNSYDYATNVRLVNGYKFPSSSGPTNAGYPNYPSSNTPPTTSHQVRGRRLN